VKGSHEVCLSLELLSQYMALPELPEVDVCARNILGSHLTPDCAMLFAENDK
jgi:hypothetical protein